MPGPRRNSTKKKPLSARNAGPSAGSASPATPSATKEKRKSPQQGPARILAEAILDAAEVLVVVLDNQGRIVQFNPVCEKLTGYTQAEVKGRRIWDLLIPPEDVEPVKRVFQELAGGVPNRHENYWAGKGGKRILISWSNTVVKKRGKVEFVIGTGIDRTEREKARTRAARNRAIIQALLKTDSQAILVSDARGRIVLANVAADAMYGYEQGELLGRPLESLIPAGSRRQHAHHRRRWFSRPQNRAMGVGMDLAGLRKDGSSFPLEVSLNFIEQGGLAVAFVSDISARKQQEAATERYQNQLRKLTEALLAAQESGSRALARELHDVYSQELAALSMDLSVLVRTPGIADSAAASLAGIGRKIHQLAIDMHGAARRLHPAVLEDLGLETALQQECRALQEQTGIPVDLIAANVPAALPEDVSICLYRVAQESLRNIARHSLASRVLVNLTGGVRELTLRIEDEGNGFELEEAMKKGGLGLISMEERVRLVHGKLAVQSQMGRGTVVTAAVPLKGVSA